MENNTTEHYKILDEIVNEKATKIAQREPKLQSDELDKISLALSAAQGEFDKVIESSNSYVGSYADLSSIINTIRPHLKAHELSITGAVKSVNNVTMFSTTIRHSSGQWIESQMPIKKEFFPINDGKKLMIQSFGSVLSYLQRYNLRLILNLASEK